MSALSRATLVIRLTRVQSSTEHAYLRVLRDDNVTVLPDRIAKLILGTGVLIMILGEVVF